MNPPSKEQQQKIKDILEKQLGYIPSDAEILECYQSLIYFAKAKHRYMLIKKGLIKLRHAR